MVILPDVYKSVNKLDIPVRFPHRNRTLDLEHKVESETRLTEENYIFFRHLI